MVVRSGSITRPGIDRVVPNAAARPGIGVGRLRTCFGDSLPSQGGREEYRSRRSALVPEGSRPPDRSLPSPLSGLSGREIEIAGSLSGAGGESVGSVDGRVAADRNLKS